MKNKQKLLCNVRVEDIEYWGKGDIYLLPNKEYTLTIDYPFSKPGYFKIRTKSGERTGFGEIIKFIYKSYLKQYDSVDEDGDNGYWHGIEDLTIEQISVDHKKKKITIDVGS